MCSLVAALLLASAPSAPQEATAEIRPASSQANTVTLAPLNLLFNSLALEYERVVHPRVSVLFTPSLTWYETDCDGAPTLTVGGGAGLGARYFFEEGAPRGLFVAAQALIGARRVYIGGVEHGWEPDWNAFGMVGSTFILGDVFVASVGAGLGFGQTDVLGFRVRAFVPAFRLNVGAAF